jgi:succinoglycan biosynthesis transport protein ExoP
MEDQAQNRSQPAHWWVQFVARVTRFRRVLARYWWILFFTSAAGLAIAGWHVFRQQTVFVSSGRMMVSGRINLQSGAVFSEELANFFGTQVELMKSSEVRMRAVNRLAAMEPELRPIPVVLSVAQLPQTSIFVFSASGSESGYTQKLLDAIMTEYIAIKKEMRSSKSDTTQTAILDEISRVERDAHQGEDELLAFQKQNNVGYLEQEGNSAGAYVSTLNRQLAELKTQYKLYESLDVDQIIEKVQNDPAHAGDMAARAADQDSGMFGNGSGPEDQYRQAKQQLAVMKAERDEFAKVERPRHPQMVEIANKISQQETLIAALRAESIERFKGKRESIKRQIDNLETVVKDWDTKALSLSRRLAEYNRIKSNVDRSKVLYDRLVNSLHDVDVTRNVDQDIVSILEKAGPAQPVKPGMERMLLLGLAGGFLVGLAILFLMHQIDDRIGSLVDLQGRFDQHILAQIPQELHRGPLEPLRENDVRYAFAEALRGLRSSLLYLPVEGQRPKTFLIASAAPNEGKSTIALNLAITMALTDVRVLLVDADLRRGDLHRWFDGAAEPGLTDLLMGQTTIHESVSTTKIPNLDLIARGKSVSNPGELLLGPRLDQFLRDVYNSYQYVIFDSSPILAADDVASLAPKIDACIFILRIGYSATRVSSRALELLSDRQANVIGIVCNDVPRNQQGYYQYKYPEYYQPKTTAS